MQPMSRVNQYVKTADDYQRDLDELIASMPQEEAATKKEIVYKNIVLSMEERCRKQISRMRALEEMNYHLSQSANDVQRTEEILFQESVRARCWTAFSYIGTTASTLMASAASIATIIGTLAAVVIAVRRSS